jgi:ammonia channel protein AmtB
MDLNVIIASTVGLFVITLLLVTMLLVAKERLLPSGPVKLLINGEKNVEVNSARSKNIVNVLGMTLLVMGLMSVQWILWGYSLAFAPNADEGANMYMGSLDYAGFQPLFVIKCDI